MDYRLISESLTKKMGEKQHTRLKKKITTYPQIRRGQLWSVEGEVYGLIDIRITAVKSPVKFMATAFFSSKEPMSTNPFIEEKVSKVISDPAFRLLVPWGTKELGEWAQKIPEGVSTRLHNILWNLCREAHISPLDLTKDEFLSLDNAGKKTWQEYESIRKIR